MFKKHTKKIFLAFGLILIISNVFFQQKLAYERYQSFDELKHIKAANIKFYDNWLSKKTLNFVEFIKIEIKKINNETVGDTRIKRDEDSFFIRNHHGILPILYLSFFEDGKFKNSSTSENKKSNTVLLIFFSILLFFIISDIFNKKYTIGFLITGIIISNQWFVDTFIQFNFHLFLGLFLTLSIYFIHKFHISKKIKFLYFYSIVSALSLLTLETSIFFIFLFSIPVLYLYKIKFKEFLLFFTIFILTIAFVNPGMFISGDIMKSIFMLIYKTLIKKTDLYSSVDFSVLLQLLKDNILFISFLFFYLLFNFKKNNKLSTLFILTGLLYIIILIPNIFSYTYLFPAILCITLGIVIFTKNNIKNEKKFFIYLIILFIISQINFGTQNYNNFNNKHSYFEKQDWYENTLMVGDDIITINQFIEKRKKINNKITAYVDFSVFFEYFVKDLNVKEIHIENQSLVITNNYEKNKFENFNDIKDIEIIILQRRISIIHPDINLKLRKIFKYKLINNFEIYYKDT
mgnify:CR=1 FL=1